MSLMVVISYANKKRAEPSGHGSTAECHAAAGGTLVKILPGYDFREGNLINLEFVRVASTAGGITRLVVECGFDSIEADYSVSHPIMRLHGVIICLVIYLRGATWAVASCSIGPPAYIISKKTL